MSGNGVCLQGDMGYRGFLGPPGIKGAKVSAVAGPGRNVACLGNNGLCVSREGRGIWVFQDFQER